MYREASRITRCMPEDTRKNAVLSESARRRRFPWRLFTPRRVPVNTPSEWSGWQVINPDGERQRYNGRVAAKLCTRCGKQPPLPDRKACTRCAAYMRRTRRRVPGSPPTVEVRPSARTAAERLFNPSRRPLPAGVLGARDRYVITGRCPVRPVARP